MTYYSVEGKEKKRWYIPGIICRQICVARDTRHRMPENGGSSLRRWTFLVRPFAATAWREHANFGHCGDVIGDFILIFSWDPHTWPFRRSNSTAALGHFRWIVIQARQRPDPRLLVVEVYTTWFKPSVYERYNLIKKIRKYMLMFFGFFSVVFSPPLSKNLFSESERERPKT